MKIGILGSGIVGRVLASAFQSEGHEVTLGTRNTSKAEVVQFHASTGIAVATFDTTAAWAELIVLATKGTVSEEAIRLAGLNNFDGKIVIDATNPIADAPPVDGALQYFTAMNESLMERLKRLVPAAKFVKAFNSVGNALMYKPSLAGGPPTMFICGDDDAAKATVTGILASFGWEAADMGKAAVAGAIEALCVLWCARGFSHNQWMHAFKLLKA